MQMLQTFRLFHAHNLATRPHRILLSCLLLWAAGAGSLRAETLSDPEVDRYNMRVGTQTFSGLYQFTTNTLLVETAEAIHDMGSGVIKFYLGSDYPRQYHLTLPPSVTNLLALARDEPSCHRVLDMPFQHFIMWAYPFANTDAAWYNGYSAMEAAGDYREMYDVTRYLLTNYNNSGKTFYLGHWEGDGYLAPWTTNAPPTALQGMIDWLNNRQKAIDDAKHDTACTNVNVFGYAEANRVRDAMLNGPTNNLRVINAVVPFVTNLDYLSYSSYDAQDLSVSDLYTTLNYMESKVPTNKTSVITGERIWIGEYGWGGSQTPDQQEPLSRVYLQRLLNRGARFALFWEIYNNETNKSFCLIDSNNVKVASYYLHQRFLNQARLLTAQFKERNGRAPTDAEFPPLVSPLFNQPLPPPVSLTVSNLAATLLDRSTAQVSGMLAQGVYGDDEAATWVFWGRQDGGTARGAWEAGQLVGVNTNFNPAQFKGILTNLVPNTNYFFRFYATNASGEVWAPSSAQFSTVPLSPSDFACRLKVIFTGYNRGEPLINFPALVNLRATLPGFSYGQFASASGGDLRFTDAGGLAMIPHEIDEWNTNGISSVWVRVPALTGTNDFVWAYWGNPAATNPPAWTTNGGVWLPEHQLVWHLKENGLPFADSALQHPAVTGVAPASTVGIAGRGGLFNGAAQFLDAGTINLGNAFTLSAWVNVAASANNIQTVWASKAGGFASAGFALYVNSFQTSDGELRLETSDGAAGQVAATGGGAVTSGQWRLLTAVVDRTGGAAHLYVDGADATQSGPVQADFPIQSDINLGRFTNGNFYFTGAMDEVRIANGARSSNWVWTSWMNVVSNTALANYSAVNPRPTLWMAASGSGPALTWPANAGVFTLYFATNLMPPITWMPATNAPVFANGQWQVTPDAGGGSMFYRLQSR
jgi:hypothetical protein